MHFLPVSVLVLRDRKLADLMRLLNAYPSTFALYHSSHFPTLYAHPMALYSI